MSPTQRALAALRKEGWQVAIVERWNPHAKIRQDLWGFCDILAVKAKEMEEINDQHRADIEITGSAFRRVVGGGTLAVQVTSASNVAARRAKISAEPRARVCLQAGWSVEVWGCDVRRVEAKFCEICHGSGKNELARAQGKHRRCPACNGRGIGKRPLKKIAHISRWRMLPDGTWEEIASRAFSAGVQSGRTALNHMIMTGEKEVK